jgi:hypothetical protein
MSTLFSTACPCSEVHDPIGNVVRDGAMALRIRLCDGHPALRSTASGGFRSVLAVSSFRFRARLDVSIPSAFSGQRGYEPRFLDIAPLI